LRRRLSANAAEAPPGLLQQNLPKAVVRILAAETAAAFFAAPGTTVIGIAGPVYLQGDGLGRTAFTHHWTLPSQRRRYG